MKFGRMLFARCAVLVAISFLSIPVLAQSAQVTLKDVKGYGNIGVCNKKNVEFISFGNNSAFVFNTFNLEYPNTKTKSRVLVSTCIIRANITVPKGYYINDFRNVINYGIVKSTGIAGGIDARFGSFEYPLAMEYKHVDRNFKRKEDINEPLAVLELNKEVRRSNKVAQCIKTKSGTFTSKLFFEIDLNSIAYDRDANLILGVDSSDFSVSLNPNVKPCKDL